MIFVESYAGRQTHHLKFILHSLLSALSYPFFPLPSKLQRHATPKGRLLEAAIAKIGVLYMRDDVVHKMGACIGVKKATRWI